MPHLEKHSQQDLTDQSKATTSRSGSPERLQQLRRTHGLRPDGGQGSGSQATSEAPRETAYAAERQRKGKELAPAEGKDRRPIGKDRNPVERLVLSDHYGPENPGLKGGDETSMSIQSIAHAMNKTIEVHSYTKPAIAKYAKNLMESVRDGDGENVLQSLQEMSKHGRDWKKDFASWAIHYNNNPDATTSS